jgi:glycosyltransferase involved in cell wall biosynthesis
MSLVSVVIPMRNAEPFIAATLRSILAQAGMEFEVVVIDDGSTDRSAELARAAGDDRVRVLPGPQRGISAAFNAGLAAARGELLCRCDADDLYPPGRLARQAALLRERPACGAVCGAYATVDPDGRHVTDHFADTPAGDMTDELLHGAGRSHVCAYLFRTELLRDLGGCREWFMTSEDADLQYRLAERTRIWFDPAVAYHYRLHDASVTHAQKSAQREFFAQAARRFLEQRRAGAPDDLERGVPPPVPASEATAGGKGARSAREQVQQILLGRAWREHALGQRARAVSTGLRACLLRPGSGSTWRSLAALALKPCRGGPHHGGPAR